MEADLETELPSLSVDGGASRNDFLMQLLSDLLGRSVIRGSCVDVSAFGAARMAAEALAVWSGDRELEASPSVFRSRMAATDRDAIASRWKEAILRTVMN